MKNTEEMDFSVVLQDRGRMFMENLCSLNNHLCAMPASHVTRPRSEMIEVSIPQWEPDTDRRGGIENK